MTGRRATGALGVVALLALVGCSSGADPAPDAALSATPSAHCASDQGTYDGLRDYLAEEAGDEPWIDRVAVCAGGLLEVNQEGMGADAARAEALDVCAVAAGYLITRPPPPERADAPNPKEIGVIVADTDGAPVVLGAKDEAAAAAGGGEEADREEAEREREEAEREEADDAGATVREAEPFRCFDPFA